MWLTEAGSVPDGGGAPGPPRLRSGVSASPLTPCVTAIRTSLL